MFRYSWCTMAFTFVRLSDLVERKQLTLVDLPDIANTKKQNKVTNPHDILPGTSTQC